MAKIYSRNPDGFYAAKTKQGVVFYSSSAEQCIYNVNSVLIGSGSDISKEIKALGKKPKLDDIVEQLSGSSSSRKDVFVAGKKGKKTRLFRLKGKKRNEIKNNTVDYSGKKQRKVDSEHKKFKIRNLGDALDAIYTTNRLVSAKKEFQLGLLCNKKPRILSSIGKESDRSDYESATTRKLQKILDRLVYVHDNNLSKRAVRVLKKKASELAQSYAKSGKGFFSRQYTGWKTSKIAKDAQNVRLQSVGGMVRERLGAYVITAKKSIQNHGKAVQDELDRVFHSKKRQDIIIGLDNLYNSSEMQKLKTEIAESLAKSLGSKSYFVFQSIPFVAVPCESRDISKVCYRINNHRAEYFGPGVSANKGLIKSAQRSRGFYIPEMFIKKAKELRIELPYKHIFRKTQKNEEIDMWNLVNIGAFKAWDITKGNGSVVVVIDTGIEYTHPEINSRFSEDKGWNFLNDSADPMDDNGHGTHCAGTVAGQETGVAPETQLIAGKVLDRNGSGTTTDIITAIDYVIHKQDYDIISMSLGSRYNSQALDVMCKAAHDSGLILCAAAGNEYFGPSYPAACTGVISVAAVDKLNNHADFSNIDSSVDISCPGVDIYSSYLNGSYRRLSGTSMATPHVAGVAGLAVSVQNTLDPDDFEDTMTKEAEKLGEGESRREEKYGAGLARADRIVSKLHSNLFKYEKIMNAVNPMRWKHAR